MKDYRKGQKVLMTLEIEDVGQDFIEVDVLENGVLLGDSLIFRNGQLTLLGIGAKDGMQYHSRVEVLQKRLGALGNLVGLYIYFRDTAKKDIVPWKANTLRYAVTKVKRPHKPNRFIAA